MKLLNSCMKKSVKRLPNQNAVNNLINIHYKYIDYLVRKYPERLHDDLYSAGMLALVQAIHNLPHLKHDNISGYIFSTIRGKIHREYIKTFKHKWYDCTKMIIHNYVDIVDVEDYWKHKLCKDVFDQVIVMMLLQKHTLEEIATKIKMSKTKVYKRVLRMRERECYEK